MFGMFNVDSGVDATVIKETLDSCNCFVFVADPRRVLDWKCLITIGQSF